MSEPLPVIPLDYASAQSTADPRWRLAARWFLELSWITCAAAWLLILFAVESALITGPILFVLGVLTVIAGARLRALWTLCVGVLHGAVCALFVMLVNLLSWSPNEPRVPFRIMGLAYCLAITPLIVVALLRSRSRTEN